MFCTLPEVSDQPLDVISAEPFPINGTLDGLWLSAQVEFKQCLQT